jgi:endonuclease YncB( thermonuclease family)
MRTLFAIFSLLLLFTADAAAGRFVEGVVKAVYDGDTILLATRNGSRLKVRLYGIDAPETKKPDRPGQPFGEAAKRTLANRIMGRRVTAEIIDIDQYKRPVAVIRYSGADVNREMVSEGFAWAYRRYLQGAYASEYIGAEDLARSRHAGLWRDANPLPPWEFRKLLKNGAKHHKRHW